MYYIIKLNATRKMITVEFQQKSRAQAYANMSRLGFSGQSFGTIGFTTFRVVRNFEMTDDEIMEAKMDGFGDSYSIVAYSSHDRATITQQYKNEW